MRLPPTCFMWLALITWGSWGEYVRIRCCRVLPCSTRCDQWCCSACVHLVAASGLAFTRYCGSALTAYKPRYIHPLHVSCTIQVDCLQLTHFGSAVATLGDVARGLSTKLIRWYRTSHMCTRGTHRSTIFLPAAVCRLTHHTGTNRWKGYPPFTTACSCLYTVGTWCTASCCAPPQPPLVAHLTHSPVQPLLLPLTLSCAVAIAHSHQLMEQLLLLLCARHRRHHVPIRPPTQQRRPVHSARAAPHAGVHALEELQRGGRDFEQ